MRRCRIHAFLTQYGIAVLVEKHAVSGGVRLKTLSRVVTTVSKLSVSVESFVAGSVAGAGAA